MDQWDALPRTLQPRLSSFPHHREPRYCDEEDLRGYIFRAGALPTGPSGNIYYLLYLYVPYVISSSGYINPKTAGHFHGVLRKLRALAISAFRVIYVEAAEPGEPLLHHAHWYIKCAERENTVVDKSVEVAGRRSPTLFAGEIIMESRMAGGRVLDRNRYEDARSPPQGGRQIKNLV